MGGRRDGEAYNGYVVVCMRVGPGAISRGGRFEWHHAQLELALSGEPSCRVCKQSPPSGRVWWTDEQKS